jgi:N-acetyltransferase
MYSYSLFEKLIGSKIILSRLEANDIESLGQALISPNTWFSRERGLDSSENFSKQLNIFLENQKRGEMLVVIARTKKTNEIVAMSIYHSANPEFTRVEIGFTWIADKWQRTFVNSELKYLMLGYAFEKMKVVRVEFMVDPRNDKSNIAMKRIGATFEGTLRKYKFKAGKDIGDRNVYSIIDDDWAFISKRLMSAHPTDSKIFHL